MSAPLQLSVAARKVPNVRKARIPDRASWLKWRTGTVGCSEIPALFGEHPYTSPFQLYGIKTGAYKPEFEEATIDGDMISLPPADVGLWLEGPTFELARRLKPHWTIEPNPSPGGYHFVHEQHRASSTPDAFIYSPDEDGPGALQIKTVADLIFKEAWMADHVFQPPLWVMIQAMMDAALSGCSWACIGVLVRGSFRATFRLYRVTLKPGLIERAFALVDDFWNRVETGRPYDPDFGRDGDIISALYGSDDAPMIDLTGERAERAVALLAQREAEKTIEAAGNEAAKRRKSLDSEIVFLLGNASGASLPDGRVVTAKVTERGAYEVKPTSFRTVKVIDPAKAAKKIGGARKSVPAQIAAMPDTF